MANGPLVWAKLKSFPWWPARLIEDPETLENVGVQKAKPKKEAYLVLFFGDSNYGWIEKKI